MFVLLFQHKTQRTKYNTVHCVCANTLIYRIEHDVLQTDAIKLHFHAYIKYIYKIDGGEWAHFKDAEHQ